MNLRSNLLQRLWIPALLCLTPWLALAGESPAPAINSGDTAWLLTATALVLFMTVPGLSLFYAGLVRPRNVLSVLMHCLAITALMTVLWLVCGYTMAFSSAGMAEGSRGLHAFVGGLDKIFLRGVTGDSINGAVPEPLFFAFQMTFFIITPALMVGAFAERIRFSALMWFVGAWALLVYVPICHMVWGGPGAFFADLGVFDFAGGIVVHITAGVGALVACLLIGPRTGYPTAQMLPHSLPLTLAGTGMLWVGWYGFNAGSAVAANGSAAMALVVTQVSAAAATLAWMLAEWITNRKPSVLGAATGAIAGLAAITPGSGFVGPVGALCIGTASGLTCWWAATRLKRRFGYDDSLDVFGVHGVGGFLGTVLVAVFAHPFFGGNQAALEVGTQLGRQLFASVFAIVYTAGLSYLILKVIDKTVGLLVEEHAERDGLDITAHGEAGYNM